MKVSLWVLSLGAAAARPTWEELGSYEWRAYKEDFQKTYGEEEDLMRRRIFEARLAEIATHNARESLYKKGVNFLTDLTEDERAARLGSKSDLRRHHATFRSPRESSSSSRAIVRDIERDRVDWREAGVVTAVKDQGQCGSCWAFASTESIESYVALATNETPPVLAPQQLVSCAANPYECGGQGGCEGSIPELAFSFVQLYGLSAEEAYPYAGQDEACHTEAKPSVIIDGFQKLPVNSRSEVVRALNDIGPLAVNVDASNWHDYEAGVFDGCSGLSDLNHVVQLVGYGYDSHLDAHYWLVRNSWAATYGEDGFIRLYKAPPGHDEACQIDPTPLDGTGCLGGPPTQTVCGQCGVIFDVSYPLGARYTTNSSSSSSPIIATPHHLEK
mmetsp:Transcript_8069/g.24938  ORF Transcript_8069/g.24938 Transcript_8069/m.24938 type:complete len:387 (-) Transcript_8069:33-1193(-)